MPVLDSIEDITAGTFDETITPGQPLRIEGDNLKLDTADENQGVFFIETATKNRTKATVFVDNQPKKLTVVAPALPQGEYEVVVRCMIGNSVKEGIYQGILSVV